MGRHGDEDTGPMTKLFRRTGGGAHAPSGGLRGSWEDDEPRARWRTPFGVTLALGGSLALAGGIWYGAWFATSPTGQETPAGVVHGQTPRRQAVTSDSSPTPAPTVTITRWKTSAPPRPVKVQVPGPVRTVYVTPSPRVSVRVEHQVAPTVRVTVRVPGPTTTVYVRRPVDVVPEEIPGE